MVEYKTCGLALSVTIRRRARSLVGMCGWGLDAWERVMVWNVS